MSLTPEQERRAAAHWRENNIRETCMACDRDAGVDQMVAFHPYSAWRPVLMRTCRYCGVIICYDAVRVLGDSIVMDPPVWPGVPASSAVNQETPTEAPGEAPA